MSVAESIVIFGPICQVGCLSASSAVTSVSSRRVLPRKGPPEEVRDDAPDLFVRPGLKGLEDCRMLAVHGKQARPPAPCQLHHLGSGDDQRFLVGQGDRLASLERRPGSLQARRAHDRAEHPVGRRVLDHPDDAFKAFENFHIQAAEFAPHQFDRVSGPSPSRTGAEISAPARSAMFRSCGRSSPQVRSRLPPSCSTTFSVLRPIEPVEPRITTRVSESPVFINSSDPLCCRPDVLNPARPMQGKAPAVPTSSLARQEPLPSEMSRVHAPAH